MWSILKGVFRHAFLTPKRRGFLDEWVVTIVILLGCSTVVQAFVIPSGSMEGTLLIGDHVLVDRLVYSPADSVSSHLLPYRDVRRGDVIVFRYPLDLNKTLVKRAIGIPGDHVRLENKRVITNGHAVDEPFAKHLPARAGCKPKAHRVRNFRQAPPRLNFRAMHVRLINQKFNGSKI